MDTDSPVLGFLSDPLTSLMLVEDEVRIGTLDLTKIMSVTHCRRRVLQSSTEQELSELYATNGEQEGLADAERRVDVVDIDGSTK